MQWITFSVYIIFVLYNYNIIENCAIKIIGIMIKTSIICKPVSIYRNIISTHTRLPIVISIQCKCRSHKIIIQLHIRLKIALFSRLEHFKCIVSIKMFL